MSRSLWCFSFVLLATLYCTGVKAQNAILFCGGIENELPMGVSDRFYPDSAGTYLYAYYAQQLPLGMKQIGMEVYKKNEDKFEPVVDKTMYSVKPKWKSTYIKCRFTSPGLYKVKLYDADQKLLGEGMVTIM